MYMSAGNVKMGPSLCICHIHAGERRSTDPVSYFAGFARPARTASAEASRGNRLGDRVKGADRKYLSQLD